MFRHCVFRVIVAVDVNFFFESQLRISSAGLTLVIRTCIDWVWDEWLQLIHLGVDDLVCITFHIASECHLCSTRLPGTPILLLLDRNVPGANPPVALCQLTKSSHLHLPLALLQLWPQWSSQIQSTCSASTSMSSSSFSIWAKSIALSTTRLIWLYFIPFPRGKLTGWAARQWNISFFVTLSTLFTKSLSCP